MPDRLRIVQPQWPKRPTVILDIASTSIQPVRDSFKVAPGKKQKRSVPQPTREGGSRVVGERLENATISVTLAILGASADNALALASSLLAALDQVVPGQFVEWRPDGASRSTYFEMRGTAEWDNQYRWVEFSGAKLLTVAVSFEVAPRGVGDLKDVLDDWTTDSLAAADWTVDAGGGTLSVSARQLVPSDTTTKRLRHTATGYTDTDVQATLQIVAGSSVAALDDTVMVCADTSAADTHLGARLAGSGVGTSPNTLAVVKRVAGTLTVLASTAFTPAASTSYWLRVRREGYVVTAEVFTQTTEPTPLGTPTASISYTLTVSEDAAFRSGHHGLRLTPGHASERYGAYRAEPYTYRSLTCPDQVQLRGAIPGDAPARADLHITTSGAGSGSGAGTGAGGTDKILFQLARQRGQRSFGVWTLDYRDGQTSNLTEIAASPTTACINPTWSPDAQKVVYSQIPLDASLGDHDAKSALNLSRPSVATLKLVNVDGTGEVDLTGSGGSSILPFWGRSGRVVFVANFDGTENIWSIDMKPAVLAQGGQPSEMETHVTAAPSEQSTGEEPSGN